MNSLPKAVKSFLPIENTNATAAEIVPIVNVLQRNYPTDKSACRQITKGMGLKKNYRKFLRIEINEKTLLRLLAEGQVCAAEINCIDCESKQCLCRLLLRSCVFP